jgi:integrase
MARSTLKLEQNQDHEYLAFSNSIRAKDTLNSYNRSLKHYMDFHRISNISTLIQQDNKTIEFNIVKYIVDMKQRNPPVSHSLRSSRLAAVKKFYEMNDVILNWKKITQYLGEKTKIVRDRAYTTEEIQQLLAKADERMRVVILLLASTGVRVGAIPDLRHRHLTKIAEYRLYQVTIYENTKDEYIVYTTPEFANTLDSYLAYRERCGEKITPESPLIREQFDPKDSLSIRRPRPLKRSSIMGLLSEIITKSGIQTIKHRTEITDRGRERKDIARAHGFRKAFTTNLIRAKVNPEIREILLGHSIGLSDSYYRPDNNEILEEYLKGVEFLTINEEYRLHRKVSELAQKKGEIEIMESKHKEEIKAIRDQMDQVISMIQQNPKLAHVKPEALVDKRI